MAERIGMSKPIKLEWLHDTAMYAVSGLGRKEAGEELNKSIGQFITNAVNIKQTRIILLNTWYNTSPRMLEEAKAVYPYVSSDEKMAIHYALLADQYQVFYDMADVLGHLFEYRPVASATQIKEKMYDKWGKRPMLDTALSKNLKSFREMGILSSAEKATDYTCIKHRITDVHVVGLLLQAFLKNSAQDYISWASFLISPFMFPFEVSGVDESHMASLPYIDLNRFDNNVVISVKHE